MPTETPSSFQTWDYGDKEESEEDWDIVKRILPPKYRFGRAMAIVPFLTRARLGTTPCTLNSERLPLPKMLQNY